MQKKSNINTTLCAQYTRIPFSQPFPIQFIATQFTRILFRLFCKESHKHWINDGILRAVCVIHVWNDLLLERGFLPNVKWCDIITLNPMRTIFWLVKWNNLSFIEPIREGEWKIISCVSLWCTSFKSHIMIGLTKWHFVIFTNQKSCYRRPVVLRGLTSCINNMCIAKCVLQRKRNRTT